MTTKKLKFEDFQVEKLSKNQQKIVQGGGGSDSQIDPGKGGGGNGNGSGNG